ncbi:hypothetical protein CPC735_000440 [Coccidioides posadasii C735 delta SOWgp]|uniref:Uncharacterized protein n=1 Tax=Coccidioides posadasii (strain C735) TaxID=222929 RepID=C5P011_COCP7|nr:hypothetical protein CPC735_000440 [Coccidioides posadasii C735 delta SOWgp]EER29788.1 hypothetical protein CPC735_000440 [Coccidioides posadasii C735 delta SOWgp]|eukprot:XP_003071933.1 hypothetical protein CPC735_000440 [Coccidioides posadasii C735 delta SOWgp]
MAADRMAISGAEDNSLASISGVDSGLGDKCFLDDGGNETDCTSVCNDDVGKDGLTNVLDDKHSWLLKGLADALKDDGDWLCNEEEHPPEHYLEEEANLDPSSLQQQQYSPRTQEKLDWVKEHWEHAKKRMGDVEESSVSALLRHSGNGTSLFTNVKPARGLMR